MKPASRTKIFQYSFTQHAESLRNRITQQQRKKVLAEHISKANSMQSPPAEFCQNVKEIIAVNRAWKASQELVGPDTNMSRSLRNLKGYLQAKLLRKHSPDWVYLEIDEQAESDEPLYGLKLVQRTSDRTNAEHLPVRVAREIFTPDEIQKFTRESP